jgi:proline iminopeptidase
MTTSSDGVRMIPITVPDGREFKVFTKKVAATKTDTEHASTGPIKMLLLHGGPGCTYEYLESFADFLPQEGIEFYYYDQLGSYHSDQPDDKSLWTVERFLDEVEQVRTALGLEDFYLFGNSWGALLGMEYGIKYGSHLRGLILSNMTASVPSYLKYINHLRQQMPAETIAIYEKYEALNDLEHPEYQEALTALYNLHICRVVPWPEPVQRMFDHLATPVYNTMQGNNEFVVTGTFKDWDRWADLHRISTPTLISVGAHDSMSVADIEEMGRRIPNSRVSICPNGSHMSFWDDQEHYFPALIKFVQDVESKQF